MISAHSLGPTVTSRQNPGNSASGTPLETDSLSRLGFGLVHLPLDDFLRAA